MHEDLLQRCCCFRRVFNRVFFWDGGFSVVMPSVSLRCSERRLCRHLFAYMSHVIVLQYFGSHYWTEMFVPRSWLRVKAGRMHVQSTFRGEDWDDLSRRLEMV